MTPSPSPATAPRVAEVARNTAETRITVRVNLDGSGQARLHTRIGFFDHMLDQIARHGMIDLDIQAEGDLHIDGHHTVEDVGIAFGQAVHKAVGDKKGIRRYGHAYVPLDEALSRVVIDFRTPGMVMHVPFKSGMIGTFDSQLAHEFFQGFVNHAFVTLHIDNLRARTRTTRPKPSSRPSRAPCAPHWRWTRARPAAFLRPRVHSDVGPGSTVLLQRRADTAGGSVMGSVAGRTVAVVDYGMGNLRSVSQAVHAAAVGSTYQVIITSEPEQVRAAERVVLPGQGAMPDCMRELATSGLQESVMERRPASRFSASASACRCCSSIARRAQG